MQEITAFIIAFVFVGIVFPKLVKNLPLFYAALGLALIVILLESIAGVGGFNFASFLRVIEGILDIVAIILLVMATGGQTLGQIAGEMGKSIDAVRQNSPSSPSMAPPISPAPAGPPTAAAPPLAAKPRIAMPPRKAPGDTSIPMD